MKQIIILVVVVILGTLWVSNIKSQVKYVDTECPVCYGCEVLDFGYNERGARKCHCADCGIEFTIYEEF